MRKTITIAFAALAIAASAAERQFRPPAVPLLTTDPFFSVWSAADRLTDADTTHWCGAKQPIGLAVTANGKEYRLLGSEKTIDAPAMEQVSLEVLPLTTVARFKGDGLEAELRFAVCALPERLEALSRPVAYVSLSVRSASGKEVPATVRLVVSGELATNENDALQRVEVRKMSFGEAVVIGRTEQRPLSEKGDTIRCNWGRFWAVAPKGAKVSAPQGELPAGKVRAELAWKVEKGRSQMMFAYDDIVSLSFLEEDMRAWWQRDGKTFEKMLAEAAAERREILGKLIPERDRQLMADFRRVGGEKYARLAALAWRQSFAACKLVADPTGKPLYFSKENGSNGCMGTVDLLYPQLPHLLLTGPTLVEATLAPIMVYSDSERWPWKHAPHDVGTYPLGNGQVYGMWGAEPGRMPVEESGNMLIAMAALSKLRGNAEFASQWWPVLTKWAQYLRNLGTDLGDQLSTDDFAGHLSHNANLSIKSILGIRAYAYMAQLRGEGDVAAEWIGVAEKMTKEWLEIAPGGRYGSYRLTFDKPDSWSMKYNLVWDRLLGFNLFPPEVAERELAAYRKLLLPYGLPLDSRKDWTKVDWLVWSATLTGKRDDFDAMIDGLYRFADETKERKPFSDFYHADTSRWEAFIARSVIGGIMIPLLYEKDGWTKYASLDKTPPFRGKYFTPPKFEFVTLTPDDTFGRALEWKWMGDNPPEGWYKPGFDDSSWRVGQAPFANWDFRNDFKKFKTNTDWPKDVSRIHVRRYFTIEDKIPDAEGWKLGLELLHDEEALIYLNGKEIGFIGAHNWSYDRYRLPLPLGAIKKGRNLLAVMVHNTHGRACFDMNLVKWRKTASEQK